MAKATITNTAVEYTLVLSEREAETLTTVLLDGVTWGEQPDARGQDLQDIYEALLGQGVSPSAFRVVNK